MLYLQHTQSFNGLYSRTTCVGRYQKDKPFWILLKQEMAGWQQKAVLTSHNSHLFLPTHKLHFKNKNKSANFVSLMNRKLLSKVSIYAMEKNLGTPVPSEPNITWVIGPTVYSFKWNFTKHPWLFLYMTLHNDMNLTKFWSLGTPVHISLCQTKPNLACDSGPTVCSSMQNYTGIGAYFDA